MTSPETWNMLGIPTGAHDGHSTGANPTISGQLWVITPPNGYGLWGITGLWVIPCKPTRDQPKSMAYHGLWVLACMGYKGVDCTPDIEQISGQAIWAQGLSAGGQFDTQRRPDG